MTDARDLAAVVRDTLRFAQDDESEAALDDLLAALEKQAADAQERGQNLVEALGMEREMTEAAEARAVRAEEALRQVDRFAGDPDVGVDPDAYEVIAGIVREALAAAGADTP